MVCLLARMSAQITLLAHHPNCAWMDPDGDALWSMNAKQTKLAYGDKMHAYMHL